MNVSKWENCRKFVMIESFAERRKTFPRAVWCWQQWQHNLVPSLTTKGKSKLYLASSDVFVKHIPNRLFALIIWFSGALYVTIRHCWSSYNIKICAGPLTIIRNPAGRLTIKRNPAGPLTIKRNPAGLWFKYNKPDSL